MKSVAQEGRKVKPIPPTTPSCFTYRKTIRTNLTGLKPAEDFFFSPFPLNFFFLSVILSFFISSSLHPFLFLFLLPAFSYLFFILIFLKIPCSYISSDLLLCILPSFFPSFLPFLFYSFFLPSFSFFIFSSFSFSHR